MGSMEVDKEKPMARACAGDAFSPADVRPARDNNRNKIGTAQRGNRIFHLIKSTCIARTELGGISRFHFTRIHEGRLILRELYCAGKEIWSLGGVRH